MAHIHKCQHFSLIFFAHWHPSFTFPLNNLLNSFLLLYRLIFTCTPSFLIRSIFKFKRLPSRSRRLLIILHVSFNIIDISLTIKWVTLCFIVMFLLWFITIFKIVSTTFAFVSRLILCNLLLECVLIDLI